MCVVFAGRISYLLFVCVCVCVVLVDCSSHLFCVCVVCSVTVSEGERPSARCENFQTPKSSVGCAFNRTRMFDAQSPDKSSRSPRSVRSENR